MTGARRTRVSRYLSVVLTSLLAVFARDRARARRSGPTRG